MTPDYYTRLGVAPSAEDEIIRAAYLVLAKRYHPDTSTAASPHDVERFRLITEAYDVLRDPRRRAYYDWCHAREEQNLVQQTQEDRSGEQLQPREKRAPGKSSWAGALNNPLVYSSGAVALMVVLVLGLVKVIAANGPSANADIAMRTENLDRSSSIFSDKAALQELTDLRQTLRQTERLAATTQDALAQERDRSQGLEKQLAARGDNEKLLVLERIRSLELEQQLAVRPDASPAHGQNAIVRLAVGSHAPPPATNGSATGPLPTSDRPVIPVVDNPATLERLAAPSNQQAAGLMARAGVLLGQGNIALARLVLERAADIGSAPALFALAETYDPAMLSAWGTVGTQGDVGRAQELYSKAFARGVWDAKDRLNTWRY